MTYFAHDLLHYSLNNKYPFREVPLKLELLSCNTTTDYLHIKNNQGVWITKQYLNGYYSSPEHKLRFVITQSLAHWWYCCYVKQCQCTGSSNDTSIQHALWISRCHLLRSFLTLATSCVSGVLLKEFSVYLNTIPLSNLVHLEFKLL